MVRQMLHEVRETHFRFETGSIFCKDSFVARFTNSTCSLRISTHFDCAAARSGNAFGLNKASSRVHKSVKKAELGKFHSNTLASPTRSRRCARACRAQTEAAAQITRELLNAESATASKALLFAQGSYS
jgi:hypothetical protein